MANEKVLVRIKAENCAGEMAFGPFLVGKAYEVPADYAALLDKRFERTTLAKDEVALQIDARHMDCFDSLSALSATAKKPEPASAKADAPKPATTA